MFALGRSFQMLGASLSLELVCRKFGSVNLVVTGENDLTDFGSIQTVDLASFGTY